MFAIGFVEEIFVVRLQPQRQVGTVDYVAPVAPPGHSLSSLQLSEKEGGFKRELHIACVTWIAFTFMVMRPEAKVLLLYW